VNKLSRILLCDDGELFRSCCREMLAEASDIEVVGEADGGYAAVTMAVDLAPDLVVMDVDMPDLDGIQATQRILARNPGVKVLAHSSGAEWQIVRQMLAVGAAGYVVKGGDPDEFVMAIRVLLAGGRFLSGRIRVPTASGSPRF
jgi:DNA-binding NarL/FixJ family response regulator